MKRLTIAVALTGAALVPATAAATPPASQGGPLGSAACTVFASPAPASTSCNFTGASGGLGYMGGSTGGFSLTHIAKRAVCTDGTVSAITGVAVSDASSTAQGPFYAGPGYTFAVGRVYTFTVNGMGWGIIGGQSSTGVPPTSEPATPSAANNYAGAADETGGLTVGSAC